MKLFLQRGLILALFIQNLAMSLPTPPARLPDKPAAPRHVFAAEALSIPSLWIRLPLDSVRQLASEVIRSLVPVLQESTADGPTLSLNEYLNGGIAGSNFADTPRKEINKARDAFQAAQRHIADGKIQEARELATISKDRMKTLIFSSNLFITLEDAVDATQALDLLLVIVGTAEERVDLGTLIVNHWQSAFRDDPVAQTLAIVNTYFIVIAGLEAQGLHGKMRRLSQHLIDLLSYHKTSDIKSRVQKRLHTNLLALAMLIQGKSCVTEWEERHDPSMLNAADIAFQDLAKLGQGAGEFSPEEQSKLEAYRGYVAFYQYYEADHAKKRTELMSQAHNHSRKALLLKRGTLALNLASTLADVDGDFQKAFNFLMESVDLNAPEAPTSEQATHLVRLALHVSRLDIARTMMDRVPEGLLQSYFLGRLAYLHSVSDSGLENPVWPKEAWFDLENHPDFHELARMGEVPTYFQERWLAALRSGRRPAVRSFLRPALEAGLPPKQAAEAIASAMEPSSDPASFAAVMYDWNSEASHQFLDALLDLFPDHPALVRHEGSRLRRRKRTIWKNFTAEVRSTKKKLEIDVLLKKLRVSFQGLQEESEREDAYVAMLAVFLRSYFTFEELSRAPRNLDALVKHIDLWIETHGVTAELAHRLYLALYYLHRRQPGDKFIQKFNALLPTKPTLFDQCRELSSKLKLLSEVADLRGRSLQFPTNGPRETLDALRTTLEDLQRRANSLRVASKPLQGRIDRTRIQLNRLQAAA